MATQIYAATLPTPMPLITVAEVEVISFHVEKNSNGIGCVAYATVEITTDTGKKLQQNVKAPWAEIPKLHRRQIASLRTWLEQEYITRNGLE